MAVTYVIDTMIFGYVVFESPQFRLESYEVLFRLHGSISALDILPQELLNVACKLARNDHFDGARILRAIAAAELSVSTWVDIRPLFARAVELSLAAKHSPYDTLLIAAAVERPDTKVLTYERNLKLKFPDQVVLVQDFLSGRAS